MKKNLPLYSTIYLQMENDHRIIINGGHDIR